MSSSLVFGDHTLAQVVDLKTPAVADVDYFVASRNAAEETVSGSDLANETLASTEPARTVTVTVTEAGTAEDTVDEVIIIGKDEAGRRVREVIDAATWDDAVEFETDSALRTVTSVQVSGWTIGGGTADTYTVGFGDRLGLGVKLSAKSDVILGIVDRAVDAVTDAEVTVDSDDVNKNTVDLSGATYNGSKQARAILNA